MAIDIAISRNSEYGVVHVSGNPRLDPRYFFHVSLRSRELTLSRRMSIAELMRGIKNEISPLDDSRRSFDILSKIRGYVFLVIQNPFCTWRFMYSSSIRVVLLVLPSPR